MDEVLGKIKKLKIGRLAIMGGTFDPVHYGHLVTAETVRTKYNFDKILFIPSGNPPHKNRKDISLCQHRYNMLQMATITNPYFEVSRIEMDRKGSSYTIDTIKELRAALGNRVDIYFITGADALLEILTWKNPSELLNECKLIAVTRPGYEKDVLTDKVEELKNEFNSDIITMDVPAYAISSTDIRSKVSLGLSIKYLVPEYIEQYILKNNLYRVSE